MPKRDFQSARALVLSPTQMPHTSFAVLFTAGLVTVADQSAALP